MAFYDYETEVRMRKGMVQDFEPVRIIVTAKNKEQAKEMAYENFVDIYGDRFHPRCNLKITADRM